MSISVTVSVVVQEEKGEGKLMREGADRRWKVVEEGDGVNEKGSEAGERKKGQGISMCRCKRREEIHVPESLFNLLHI